MSGTELVFSENSKSWRGQQYTRSHRSDRKEYRQDILPTLPLLDDAWGFWIEIMVILIKTSNVGFFAHSQNLDVILHVGSGQAVQYNVRLLKAFYLNPLTRFQPVEVSECKFLSFVLRQSGWVMKHQRYLLYPLPWMSTDCIEIARW